MLQLLKQIEAISSCRDRDILGASIVAAIHELFQARRATLLRLVPTPHGPAITPVARVDEEGLSLFGEAGENGACAQLLETAPLLHQAYLEGHLTTETRESGFTCAYPLNTGPGTTPGGFLQVDMSRTPTAMEHEALERFLHFYCNYINLLDYSELDTLTGLLNRKTFDEAFDKIIARSSGSQDADRADERRSEDGDGNMHWLAVVDIDHFKRVNDNFGHLFGDEVLLRIASLMRCSFRSQDRLFRFGGEEFVVMLRVGDRNNAAKALERLRRMVETHEFPQVGQVTCSIGFTAVDPRLAPTDILGQADEALYYAKEHGRNQVCCYESLVEHGLLVPNEIQPQQPEIDIDALFA
jgi:diguanylate cyclase (GGDEF)-like protein